LSTKTFVNSSEQRSGGVTRRDKKDAALLRGVLKDIEPTEQEFRTIFKWWQDLKPYAPDTPEFREAAQANKEALQELLGPSRFELYVKGVEPFIYAK
jgi:hypothetical protein